MKATSTEIKFRKALRADNGIDKPVFGFAWWRWLPRFHNAYALPCWQKRDGTFQVLAVEWLCFAFEIIRKNSGLTATARTGKR